MITFNRDFAVEYSFKGKSNTNTNTYWFTVDPTGNCQLMFFNQIEQLILCETPEFILDVFDSIKKERIIKNMILFDVHQRFLESESDIFENTEFESPYNSTNGSFMTIVLIKTEHFLKNIKKRITKS